MLSFFLSLGVPAAGHFYSRVLLTVFWSVLCLWMAQDISFSPKTWAVSVWLFAAVFIFEIVRAGFSLISNTGLEPSSVQKRLYISSLVLWGTYFLGYLASYAVFTKKSRALFFLQIMAVLSFLMAVYFIPRLLQVGNPLISNAHIVIENRSYVFEPFLYGPRWVAQYFLPSYSHPNRMGDYIVLGFFPALGLLFYTFLQFKARIKNAISYMEKPNAHEWSLFFLYITMALVAGAGILLFFSRGTMVPAAVVFLLTFLAIAFKFPSKIQWFFLICILTVGLLFFSWAGNLNSAWKEVQTLKAEKEAVEAGAAPEIGRLSIHYNQEGARRALRMFRQYPVWGVGTGGYRNLYLQYSTGEAYNRLNLANMSAICHYLHLMAEEGATAFLYFAFLIFYLIELCGGLFSTKSQFKFLAALSFAAPAASILIHAAINDLMQRFTVAMPVYLLMGASLAVLRKDFQHDA